MLEQSAGNKEHQLQMTGRRMIRLTGVTEVISFDPQEVLLETCDGQLRLVGNHMHVKRFEMEKGEAEIEGKVRELLYKEIKAKNTAGMFGRVIHKWK